jgi:hypothetical protein
MRDELALSYMDERGGQIKDNMVSLKMVLKGEQMGIEIFHIETPDKL